MKHSSRSIIEAGHSGDGQLAIAALASGNAKQKSAALGALLRLNILDYDGLLGALRDPAPEVRHRALTLAPRWVAGRPDAERRALARAVATLLDDPGCAEPAAFALGELEVPDPAVVAALSRQARSHDDPLCRESAVAALGALGQGREAVLAATADVATVRRRAVIALAAFDGPEVDEALQAALDDRDWQVRQAAEDLLAE